jgi:hypothetical protein
MRRPRAAILLTALAIAGLSLATRAARANTVDIVHDGYGAHGSVFFTGAGYDVFDFAEAGAGVYMLNKTADSGIGNTWPNALVPSFCIELQETAPTSTYTYQVMMPEDAYNSITGQTMGTTKANYIRELWAKYYDSAWAAGGTYTAEQNAAAEAFAAAIWEILYEDLPATPLGWDITTDGTAGIRGFRAEDLDTTLANTWLHSLTGSGPKADLRVFVNQGQQDYLVAVPEPATVLLLGLGGLLSLMGGRRRRLYAAHRE